MNVHQPTCVVIALPVAWRKRTDRIFNLAVNLEISPFSSEVQALEWLRVFVSAVLAKEAPPLMHEKRVISGGLALKVFGSRDIQYVSTGNISRNPDIIVEIGDPIIEVRVQKAIAATRVIDSKVSPSDAAESLHYWIKAAFEIACSQL